MDRHLAPAFATAADVMTESVISVTPDRSVNDVAKVLLDAAISAVPVVDTAGALLGIVSEGDLLGRSAGDRLAGQEWWLELLSRPGHMQAAIDEAKIVRQAKDVMHGPVTTVDADTPVRDVAELLRVNRIKRVPVMRDGRVVGIVSRADLLRALEERAAAATGGFVALVESFFGGTAKAAPSSAAPAPKRAPMTASAFRHLEAASVQAEVDEKSAAAHASDLQRIAQVKAMMHDHLGSEMWDTLMVHARVVAAHGGKETELLRFPSDLCSDSGRKINNVDKSWADTLRGEPAELYARWDKELRPAGFGLAARVVDYPNGMPGNVALTLTWGTEDR